MSNHLERNPALIEAREAGIHREHVVGMAVNSLESALKNMGIAIESAPQPEVTNFVDHTPQPRVPQRIVEIDMQEDSIADARAYIDMLHGDQDAA